ncbi:MAG TPA: glycosyltransferase, partial [Hydrogenothermaceae bacterium]|nr:glycosyltransferase [Hydrogenothermaceae bacterium]
MRISIALATYNGDTYLQDQLNSYIAQERLPDEMVVCDDVSKDETVAILEAFQKVAPFEVQIIKNETNLGYTKNFEKALSLCSGDIVFFSDQDDV